MKKYLWKSLKKGIVSARGDFKWELKKWYHEDGNIECCKKGFHASENIVNAISFVNCGVLAKVEVKGKNQKESDKQCWSDMKIVKIYEWKKEDSVRLAIFAAELVIDIFEKKYPNDKRPREAIEAAKNWLKNPTARAAARAANAANAAANAVYAVDAVDAARAAADAARILNKCEKFILKEICKGHFSKN